LRKRPVWDAAQAAPFSGVPATTSLPPPLPREFDYHSLATQANRIMGTTYRPEELERMPEEELILLRLWARAMGR